MTHFFPLITRTAPQVFNYFGGRECDGLISQNLSDLNRAFITKQIRLQDFCDILRLRFFSVYCSVTFTLFVCRTRGILMIIVVQRFPLQSLIYLYIFIYLLIYLFVYLLRQCISTDITSEPNYKFYFRLLDILFIITSPQPHSQCKTIPED